MPLGGLLTEGLEELIVPTFAAQPPGRVGQPRTKFPTPAGVRQRGQCGCDIPLLLIGQAQEIGTGSASYLRNFASKFCFAEFIFIWYSAVFPL
jgi:hypothetical protein